MTPLAHSIDEAVEKLRSLPPDRVVEVVDFIGLDTILYIADIMFEEFKDSHYAAPPLLRRMVNAGYLGKKVKRGFYDYTKK